MVRILEKMRTDVLHWWRMMRGQPAFALAVIATLALGIAGSTTIFTVLNGVLFTPLPYRHPEELVRVSLDSRQRELLDYQFSLTRYQDVRDATRSFSDFGAFNLEEFTLSVRGQPEQMFGARVSGNFLHILGVQPQIGRAFLPGEDAPGGTPVALISDSLWRRRFHSRPDVIGAPITLNFLPYRVIGVLTPGFAFPSPALDIWVTDVSQPSEPMPHASPATVPYLTCFGRLKPRTTLEQARAELNLLSRIYGSKHPGYLDTDPSTTVRIVRLRDQITENVKLALWILFGAVCLLLLIACANVAGLLVARAISRQREFAIRSALGAARLTLIRQLLIESVMLGLVGGGIGLLATVFAVRGITRLGSVNLPRLSEVHLDGAVLLFALLMSIGTGVLFGLFPFLHLSASTLSFALRQHGTQQEGGHRRVLGIRIRGHYLIVVGQVAMCIVLLINSALLFKSLIKLRQVELGFQPSNLLAAEIILPSSRYTTDRKKAVFFKNVIQRVAAVPGVHGVALAASLPTMDAVQFPIQVAGQPMARLGDRPIGQWQAISAGYFRTLAIPLLRGREFTEHDNLDSPWVVIINDVMARRFWPAYPAGPDPVGQHLLLGANDSISAQIVGIVANVHESTLAADIGPEAYMPFTQRCLQTMYLVIRTQGDPHRFANAIRREVLSVDPDQPVSKIATVEEVLNASLSSRRLTSEILACFAGAALLLAAIGIYGILAYSVAQRRREIGIRYAVGAQRSDILALMIRQGLMVSLIGLLIGIPGSVAVTRQIRNLLFGMSATDPAVFVSIAAVFIFVALMASYIPAKRAVRTDPKTAMQ